MAWARIDDGFHDHPKVDEITLAAIGLWTLCLTWAHRHRRTAIIPGHVTAARVRKVAGKQGESLAAELVAARLWDVEEGVGGWVIHDFADYLPKERDPDERRQAGRNGAAKRWERDSKLPPDAVGNDGSCASAPASPSRPVPLVDGSLSGERPETPQPAAATEPTCSKHPLGDGGTACGGCAKVREWRDRNEQRAKDEAERARSLALIEEQRRAARDAVPMPAELRKVGRKAVAS